VLAQPDRILDGLSGFVAVGFLSLSLGCQTAPVNPVSQEGREAMAPVLHIALQDGFADDTVVVGINGEEVFRKDDVATDPRISVADSYEMPMQDGPIKIEVDLPKKDIQGFLTIQFTGSAYVAVSIEEGSIRYKVSDRPYGYV